MILVQMLYECNIYSVLISLRYNISKTYYLDWERTSDNEVIKPWFFTTLAT